MLCLEYVIEFSHNFGLEMRPFVTNMSLCYSKPLVPVYKSMYDHLQTIIVSLFAESQPSPSSFQNCKYF